MIDFSKIKPSLKVLKSFKRGSRSFEAGDFVLWEDLRMTALQMSKLIHEGILEDPTIIPDKKTHGKKKR